MINKVLIANRSEIACRIIRSCRELGIRSVAIHSDADNDALHVRRADEAYSVGPAPARESYLAADKILEIARKSGADAIHPGYGFLAESADFARAVQGADLIWVGPDPATISEMGDKQRARVAAQGAGVPVLPGSLRFHGAVDGNILQEAARIGFPLLVKAAAGGGGIGMRLVKAASDLAAAVRATQALAEKAFGDGTVYLERFVQVARHVEVQVFGFGDGRAVHFFERDCSIQRRFQKIIEESPAPQLSANCRQRMYAAALALAQTQKYRGVGTVEFLVDANTEEFYFLEMNTRIQVEHPVTEMVTSRDLVALQLRLAGGNPIDDLRQEDIQSFGHAIECRVYAERPMKNFLPATGRLTEFPLPAESEVLRIDTGLEVGSSVTHYYDPMIAKVIVRGADRNAAVEALSRALKDIRIAGVETNLDMLRHAVDHPAFRRQCPRTDFIEIYKNDLIGAA